jgi:hypothetical protein
MSVLCRYALQAFVRVERQRQAADLRRRCYTAMVDRERAVQVVVWGEARKGACREDS